MQLRKWVVVCLPVVAIAGGVLAQRRELNREKNPAVIQRVPGLVVAPRPNSLPPSFAALAAPQGFTLAGAYFFENAAQGIAPGHPQCGNGRIVLTTGTDPVNVKLRTLSGAPATPASATLPLPATAEAATDHMLLKMKDGGLLALRTVITWGPHPFQQPNPAWWDKVTIQSRPKGARVAVMAFRSTNCGKTWHHTGTIDPLMYAGGRFAVPRPTEANCPQGCFGGWDRVDAYADPFTGHIWVSANAAGGPIIDYATGQQKEAAKGSNFVWVSMNGGRDFHEVLQFGAWTPMVMTSTPNGRVYIFSGIGNQPTLYYTLLNKTGTKIQFSAAKSINYVENGKALPGGVDDPYGQFVYKFTNSISRISTDAKSSKVRLAYQYVDQNGRTAIAVVKAEIPANDGDPIVTPIRTIRASTKAQSTLAAAFIDPDAATVNTTKSNTALLYWMEGSLDATVPSQARYILFRGDKDFTPAAKLSGSWTPTTGIGHYMAGGSYLGPNNKPAFVAQWAQPNSINANIVTASQ